MISATLGGNLLVPTLVNTYSLSGKYDSDREMVVESQHWSWQSDIRIIMAVIHLRWFLLFASTYSSDAQDLQPYQVNFTSAQPFDSVQQKMINMLALVEIQAPKFMA